MFFKFPLSPGITLALVLAGFTHSAAASGSWNGVLRDEADNLVRDGRVRLRRRQ
jgi:hypothetical protein